jgi:hypothetical protein
MTMCDKLQELVTAAVMGCFACGIAAAQTAPYPSLVTAQTRANPKALAGLERPGKIVFSDGFESPESVKKYFEIRGLREGRVKLVADASTAHSGSGAIQFTAVARDGRESGSGASGWLGAEGYERLYFRRYIKFAADYDQEHMIQVNGVGQANGELAAWIDGKLYIHYNGFRWRTSADVKLKRFDIGVYVHQAAKDNTVWYDDVVLSTGYVGLATP